MATETTLVILGASGDLTSRLLLPALGQLLQREPHRRVRLRGAGMDDWDDARWREVVRAAFAAGGVEDAFDIVAETTYLHADITDPADLARVMADPGDRLALYFAVPPAVAAAACEAMAGVAIPDGTVLALEKPFGVDEPSARRLNATVSRLVPEAQIFRVDHFLGRSTTLNVLGVRFANRIFAPVWSAEHIESVVVKYDEVLGLEGRAGYYDKAGALVDMIQSHLLQVMAFLAMEPPATLHERDFRDATGAVLRATHIWQDDPVAASRRARYTAGAVGDRSLPSYADEPGVDPSRGTETLAELTCEVRNERWRGVPFTLRSGKALAGKDGEVVVTFRPVNHVPDGLTGAAPGSVLHFSLGPDRMELELNVNGGDDPFELERATLEADLGAGALKAYGEVLSGILDADATLAVRGDAAEESWRIVDPVLAAWRAGEVPLDEYPAGSLGPDNWRRLP
ncbi:glucose-6-phosphate dehydrogenase [Microbacterium sp. M3]|uniref:Glucose-6-phosphate dehydrogenase n=1 Tax=Microbacterium arthrosphaerae TaxID=792652 RepID=A0ABU4H431_9MICO|nr:MULTISPECIES: glucose-6-phosphate dehydrogenase [Microbacterium]MDW4574086.1 glucose-6-phosphate dehydrogenase [Microbacterium arthrosphaerae]MDW7607941.1 glucose-6-phosphate dehydrogenase [Microbacterium sp. M3]